MLGVENLSLDLLPSPPSRHASAIGMQLGIPVSPATRARANTEAQGLVGSPIPLVPVGSGNAEEDAESTSALQDAGLVDYHRLSVQATAS